MAVDSTTPLTLDEYRAFLSSRGTLNSFTPAEIQNDLTLNNRLSGNIGYIRNAIANSPATKNTATQASYLSPTQQFTGSIVNPVASYQTTSNTTVGNDAATKAAEQALAQQVTAPVAGRVSASAYGGVSTSTLPQSLLTEINTPTMATASTIASPTQATAATSTFTPNLGATNAPTYTVDKVEKKVNDLGMTPDSSTVWDANSKATASKGVLSKDATATDMGALTSILGSDGQLLSKYKVYADQAGLSPSKYAQAAELGFTDKDGSLKKEYEAIAAQLTDAQMKNMVLQKRASDTLLRQGATVTGQTADLNQIPQVNAATSNKLMGDFSAAILTPQAIAAATEAEWASASVTPAMRVAAQQLGWTPAMTADAVREGVTENMLVKAKSLGVSSGMLAAAQTGVLSGSGVAKAIERTVNVKETVQGQLAQMFADSPNGETPRWAKPAVDKVESILAARGFSNSTVARDALYSAIITSATPIAQADAQVYQSAYNMTAQNRQQVELANAAQQANFQLTNLNNRQQTALANAAMYVDVAKLNFTAEQQRQLANAQTYADIAKMNLSNKQQVELVNAAARIDVGKFNMTQAQQSQLANADKEFNMAQLNLNNKQQALLLASTQYVDLTKLNLTNKQQMALTKATSLEDLQKLNLTNQQQASIINAANKIDLTKFNLTQKQQAILANADKSFTLQQMDFNADQQNKIFNATMYGDIAKLNLTNQQQANLMNVQTFSDLAKLNLSNRQATELANLAADLDMEKLNAELTTRASQSNAEAAREAWMAKLDASVKTELFNAAQVAQMDMANADRVQQVNITNAQNYLQMAMNNTNLDQQRLMADRQNKVQAILSDQAAVNMQKQFTATTQADFIKMREQLATQIDLDTKARKDAVSLANANNSLQKNIQQAQLNTQASVANAQLKADLAKSQAELTQRNNEFNATNKIAIQKFNAELLAQVGMKDAELVTQANISAATLATQNRGYSFDYLASELTSLADYNKSIDYANINAMSQQLTSYYETMAKIQEATLMSGAEVTKATVTASAGKEDSTLKFLTGLAGLGAEFLKNTPTTA